MKSADRFVDAARKLNDWKRLQDEESAARQQLLSAFDTWENAHKAAQAAERDARLVAYEATCELAEEMGGDRFDVVRADNGLIAEIERIILRVKHGLDG